jgi:hypothetical protein
MSCKSLPGIVPTWPGCCKPIRIQDHRDTSTCRPAMIISGMLSTTNAWPGRTDQCCYSLTSEDTMKTDNVTSARHRNDWSIELTITDPFARTTTKKRYVAIRGGISWPTPNAPAFVCIVGQEYVEPPVMPPMREEKIPIGSRRLLEEYESKSLSLNDFYEFITDRAEQLLCRSFYVKMPEERLKCGYLNDLEKFASERKSSVSLCEAYDADDFLLGLSRIKGSIDKGGLIVPKDSYVFSQLQRITKEDLNNSPEETFYSINAMSNVIGSYYRYAPSVRHGNRRRPARNWRVM